jgi:hypothetical protein
LAPIVDGAGEPSIAEALAAGRAMSDTDAAAYALATVREHATAVAAARFPGRVPSPGSEAHSV